MSGITSSSRLRRLGIEGLWTILGQAFAIVGSFVGLRVLTGYLQPDEYGELALALTLASLISIAIMAPLSHGAARFLAPATEGGHVGGYFAAVGELALGGAVAVFGVGIASSLVLGVYAGNAGLVLLAVMALVLANFDGFHSILSWMQTAARKRGIVAIHQGLNPWARFLAATALVTTFGPTSLSALTGFAIAMVALTVSQLILIRRSFPGFDRKSSPPWRKQIWRYASPFAIWGLFHWGQMSTDRWALNVFTSTRDVGLYAVVLQLGYFPMITLTGLAMQFLSPILYARAGDASDERRNAEVKTLSWQLTCSAFGLTAVAFAAAWVFHEQVFALAAAPEYAAASHFLPWVVLGGGLFATGQTAALSFMSRLRTRPILVVTVVSCVLGMGLNVAGAYFVGLRGVIMASTLFGIVYVLGMTGAERMYSAN